MKTLILALLFLASTTLAGDWQGPRPAVTQTELPEYVKDAIRERLNDPESMQIVSWTLPVLETWQRAGTTAGKWNIRVNVRARNPYGGFVVAPWAISIRENKVLFCSQLRY